MDIVGVYQWVWVLRVTGTGLHFVRLCFEYGVIESVM